MSAFQDCLQIFEVLSGACADQEDAVEGDPLVEAAVLDCESDYDSRDEHHVSLLQIFPANFICCHYACKFEGLFTWYYTSSEQSYLY